MIETWPTYGHDPGHSGHGTTVTAPAGEPTVAWRHDLDGLFAYHEPAVGTAYGRPMVYVAPRMTQVQAPTARAVNGETGDILWGLYVTDGIGTGETPAVGDGIVGFPDGTVVDARSGRVLVDLDRKAIEWATTLVDGRVHPGFRAFHVDTGDVAWEYDEHETTVPFVGPDGDVRKRMRYPQGSEPAVVDGVAYLDGVTKRGEYRFDGEHVYEDVEATHHVYAVDAASGEHLWRTRFEPTDGDGRSGPTVATTEGIYFVRNGTLYAFDRSDGIERWRVDGEFARVTARRPAVANERVFVAAADRAIVALDAVDGVELWRVGFDDAVAGAPAVVDDVVYVADASGTVHAFGVDGSRRWRVGVGERLGTGPVIANERIYVAGDALFCLSTSN